MKIDGHYSFGPKVVKVYNTDLLINFKIAFANIFFLIYNSYSKPVKMLIFYFHTTTTEPNRANGFSAIHCESYIESLLLTIETGGNPPSSIRSALKAACSNSLSLASFCLAALWASDLE